MPRPESIIYQHAITGVGRIFTGPQDSRTALIQPHELQAAVLHAEPLFQAADHKASEADLEQVVQLYNTTVADGRFIDELLTDPKSVAAKLGIEFSDSAAEEFKKGVAAIAHRFGSVSPFLPKKIIAIAIAAGIVLAAEPSESYDLVFDSSGLLKL